MVKKVMGVDGCRVGWFGVWQAVNAVEFGVFASIQELWSQHRNASRILVDIPIGLTDDRPRHLEFVVRSLLKRKSASVFPVPCRQAVYAQDYQQACRINFSRFGKKISRQAWNICPRIRDMDQFLQGNEPAQSIVGESHPELVFAILAGNELTTSKKKPQGAAQRLDILSAYNDSLAGIYEHACAAYARKDVARDDILDAMALFIAAGRSCLLSTRKQFTEGGIAIQMHVPLET